MKEGEKAKGLNEEREREGKRLKEIEIEEKSENERKRESLIASEREIIIKSQEY